MQRTERFRDLQDVQRYHEALRASRNAHAEGIRQHWNTLGEGEFRSAIISGTARGLWKAWNPFSSISVGSVGSTDLATTLLGLALGSRARTGWGRALVYGFSVAAPYLMDGLKQNERVQHFMSEIQRSWQRIVERWRDRGAGHE